MKKILIQLKWLISQSKPVLLYLLLIIVLGSIASIVNVYRAIVTKTLIDTATIGDTGLIIRWMIVFALTLCVDIAIGTIIPIMTTYCSGKITNNIQHKLYTHLIYSEWMEHSKYHSINLLTRITNDVSTVTSVLTTILPNIISYSVMLIAAFVTLLYLEPVMALLAIIVFPFCLLVSKFYGRKQKKIYMDIQDEEVTYRTHLQESLQNLLTVKVFTKEKKHISTLVETQSKKLMLLLKRSRLNAVASAFIQVGAWIGYFLVFIWGAFNLSTGTNAFGTLTALLQLFGNIQGSFLGFAHALPKVINSIGATERLMDIEQITLEQKNSFYIPKPMDRLGIEFKHVHFHYQKNLPVLHDISFSLNPGDMAALVGISGEGKTTIIRLLLSLIHPISGNIYFTFNHKKLDVNSYFRNFISYIPQGNTLFSGTIRDNICYGNSTATDMEIEEALILSCSSNFIGNLDHKLATHIGEKGLGLSEGQVQRLAIARALLRKTPILILDEATSAIDSETECSILQSIQNLQHKPTCIIISHRPSTLAICNKTFMITNGSLRIVNHNAREKIN